MTQHIFYKVLFCLSITLFFSANVRAVEYSFGNEIVQADLENDKMTLKSNIKKERNNHNVINLERDPEKNENSEKISDVVLNNIDVEYSENNEGNTAFEKNNKFVPKTKNSIKDNNSDTFNHQIDLPNSNDSSNNILENGVNDSIKENSFNNFGGVFKENINEKIIGIDNRIKVDNVFENPYKKIVHLQMKYKEGNFQGSGALIKSNVVLTAAHNIYNKNLGGYPLETIVLAGLNNQKPTFGIAKAIDYFVPKEWETSEEKGNDFGIIRLNKNLGEKTGTFKIALNQQVGEYIETAGYPGDKPQRTLYKTSGQLDEISNDELTYKLDTFGGQSGSPVWNMSKEIVGIHIKGSVKNNYATRLTKNKLDRINNWSKEPYKEDYEKSVTLSREKISVWKDLTLKTKVPLKNIKLGNVYTAKHLFKHHNKQKYLSLYDGYNKLVGYFNKRDVTDFKPSKVHKNIKIINGNYQIIKNLLKRNVVDTTKKYLNKTLYAKTIYTLGNKQKVYSVYLKNKHLGFIDIRAAKVV